MRGKSYTIDEILRANRLKQYLPWDAVASILERPVDSLRTIVSRHRKGWRPCYPPEKTERMIKEYIAGKSLSQLAKETGVVRSAVSQRFDRAGFDAEVRAEYRKGRKCLV